MAVLLPSKPDILTNFFASERAGRRVSCEDFTAATEPEVSKTYDQELLHVSFLTNCIQTVNLSIPSKAYEVFAMPHDEGLCLVS